MSRAVVSRRAFLGGAATAGAFVLGTRLVPVSVFSQDALAQGPWEPGVYLAILPDGLVQIIAHRSEMGTGARTSLPLIVADELDADWARVKVVQAIGDKKYGSQNTDGSCSVRDFYEPMRVAGATARTMLEQAAARTWNVPVTEVSARNHAVVHAATGRSLGYGELAATARTLPIPAPETLRYKKAEAYRYIGKPVPTVDLGSPPMRCWSTMMAVVNPSRTSTSGRSNVGMKPCTKALYVSLMSRCDSAAIVPNTSEDLPDPETPVNTVKRRFGISTLMSLRLFSRAPRTRIQS